MGQGASAAPGGGRVTRVAVCIPAHGDPEGLDRLLRSLARVNWPRRSLQIVVAVDGPDRRLEAVVQEHAHEADLVVLPTNRGSYAARNAAIERVLPATDVVLFTDSDAVVDPGWIQAHVRSLEHAPRSGGAVVFDLDDHPSPAAFVDSMRHLDQRRYVEELHYAATVNLGVRREVLDALRFDDRLRSGGDFDFGQRAEAAGFGIVFSSEAVVHHRPRTSVPALLRKMDRVARGAAVLNSSGYRAADRHRTRRSVRAAAHSAGIEAGWWWSTRAAAVDVACSVTFARREPSVILPALRRRLSVKAAR